MNGMKRLLLHPSITSKQPITDYKVRQQYVITISVGDDPEFYPNEVGSKTIGDTTVTVNIIDVNDVPVICTDLPTQVRNNLITPFRMPV